VSRFDVLSVDSFTAVVLIMIRAFTYGQDVQNGISALNEFLPFVDTMDRFEQRLARREAPRLSPDGEKIESLLIEDIYFSYPDRPAIISELTIALERGKTLGIIGPSGAGKSTLIQILLGLIEPERARFVINGREISFIEYQSRAREIAFVPQTSQLVRGTIYDNIVFYRDQPQPARFEEALRKSMLSDDLSQMPKGVKTEVGVGGHQLSGGQRQRIAIARALLYQPSHLILDEPTSSLDRLTQTGLRTTIQSLKAEVGIAIVTHSPDLHLLFDEVIELSR